MQKTLGSVSDMWKVVMPIKPDSVREVGNMRDSSDANAENPNCDESCYALHSPVPED